MAQAQNEHLTTEQFSAFLDKQLSPQEQAFFDAHISSCQQCLNKLADLRLTTALLHSLPVEEVPRSFVLPASISIVPDRITQHDGQITSIRSRQRTQQSVLHRSIRIASALAAVLALCFIISGVLPLIYNSVGNSASNTSSSSTFAPVHPGAATPGVHQPSSALPSVGSAAKTSPTTTATAPSSSDHATNPGQSPAIPLIIDLSQPLVRLGIGVLVLVISIIVLIITRRRQVAVH